MTELELALAAAELRSAVIQTKALQMADAIAPLDERLRLQPAPALAKNARVVLDRMLGEMGPACVQAYMQHYAAAATLGQLQGVGAPNFK